MHRQLSSFAFLVLAAGLKSCAGNYFLRQLKFTNSVRLWPIVNNKPRFVRSGACCLWRQKKWTIYLDLSSSYVFQFLFLLSKYIS